MILKDGRTPLHVAVQSCESEATKSLLERNANINTTDKVNDFPFMRFFAIVIVCCLSFLCANSDIQISFTKLQHTPLYYAAFSGDHELLALLVKYEADIEMIDEVSVAMRLFFARDYESVLICRTDFVRRMKRWKTSSEKQSEGEHWLNT